MTEIEMITLCRIEAYKEAYNSTLKHFKITQTARKEIMTLILKEERSWTNLTKPKEKNNG